MKKLEELRQTMRWEDDELNEFIKEIAEKIVSLMEMDTINLSMTKDVLTEEKASKYLHLIGAASNLKGFNYLKEALQITFLQPVSEISVTKELYPEIAEKFGTTSPRVERGIRHCIERIFDAPNMDIINAVFGYSVSPYKGKPSNSEFIAASVEYLKVN